MSLAFALLTVAVVLAVALVVPAVVAGAAVAAWALKLVGSLAVEA